MALLVAAAILIDIGLSANLVLSQRAILGLHPGVANRLNGLFRTMFLTSGALGSALAGVTYAKGGWDLVSYVGIAFIAAGLLFYLTEFDWLLKSLRTLVHRRGRRGHGHLGVGRGGAGDLGQGLHQLDGAGEAGLGVVPAAQINELLVGAQLCN